MISDEELRINTQIDSISSIIRIKIIFWKKKSTFE